MVTDNEGGGRLPPTYQPDPEDPDTVYSVDQVTAENRGDLHKSSQEMQVGLFNEDLSKLLHTVYIPRTREMPDCVRYHGDLYVFHNTNKPLPEYTPALIVTGTFHPQNREKE